MSPLSFAIDAKAYWQIKPDDNVVVLPKDSMSDISREFDAMFRSENAQLYGMGVSIFRRLADACIAVHRYGSIVAHTIEPAQKGDGCNVLWQAKTSVLPCT